MEFKYKKYKLEVDIDKQTFVFTSNQGKKLIEEKYDLSDIKKYTEEYLLTFEEAIKRIALETRNGKDYLYEYINHSEQNFLLYEKGSKQDFIQGDCAGFAVALKEYFPEYKYGMIAGLLLEEDFDEEEDEEEDYLYWEGCHAVLILDKDHYIDVNGINKFKSNDKNVGFSSKPRKIELRKLKDKEELNRYFGSADEGVLFFKEAIYSAKKYLKENPKFIKDLKEELSKIKIKKTKKENLK